MAWNRQRSGPWIAAGGLFVVAWLTLTSAFYASPWALTLLLLLGPEAMAVDMLARSGRRAQTMIVPLVAAVIWFLGVSAGARWLGWG